ncbi:hypothetical protein LENED_004324 [Lentinula edodes]|uniref:Uncharacterized protein n=1 Tax=Lentinula edodes TaxID=5353 RepID=A0A1Q3E5W3_LENED|nr:hypothetical protein LENED_004324 [Lentinula edodes]
MKNLNSLVQPDKEETPAVLKEFQYLLMLLSHFNLSAKTNFCTRYSNSFAIFLLNLRLLVSTVSDRCNESLYAQVGRARHLVCIPYNPRISFLWLVTAYVPIEQQRIFIFVLPYCSVVEEKRVWSYRKSAKWPRPDTPLFLQIISELRMPSERTHQHRKKKPLMIVRM